MLFNWMAKCKCFDCWLLVPSSKDAFLLLRIDMPVVKWADKVVSKAKAGGMKIPEPELNLDTGEK